MCICLFISLYDANDRNTVSTVIVNNSTNLSSQIIEHTNIIRIQQKKVLFLVRHT